ncbi:MAG: aminoacyl-tRNA hydrolase [Spirochaetes bacterium]|nr:aminoacyl-tRNA hydrolase [Spirochaetota bacterium]
MKLIVGFGNPGDKHVNNRQNIGFKVVDIIANNANIDIRVKKKKSLIGRGKIGDCDVVLLKPQTFVNLIGESVLYVASFLRIKIRDVICIFEDTSLPLGKVRVDYAKTEITNDGIESISKGIKTGSKFPRVIIGVGKPDDGEDLQAYLLKDFTFEENLIVIDILNKTERVILDLLKMSVEAVQDKYNPAGTTVREKKREVIIRKVK